MSESVTGAHACWHWNRMQGISSLCNIRVSLFQIKFIWNTKLLWLSFASGFTKCCCTHANISLIGTGRRSGCQKIKIHSKGGDVLPSNTSGDELTTRRPHGQTLRIYTQRRLEEFTRKRISETVSKRRRVRQQNRMLAWDWNENREVRSDTKWEKREENCGFVGAHEEDEREDEKIRRRGRKGQQIHEVLLWQ